MKASVELKNIPETMQESVEEIVEDMNRKLKRAKKPLVTKDDLTWFYFWGEAIGSNADKDRLKNLGVSLVGKLGLRESYSGVSSRKEDLPYEVLKCYEPKPKVDSSYPHIAVLKLDDGKDFYVTGGYKKGSDNILMGVYDGSDIWSSTTTPSLLLIQDDKAFWNGCPRSTFYKRLLKCAVGDGFRYINKTYTRLRTEDIENIVANKVFKPSFGRL